MSRTVTAAGHPALRITLFGLFFASGVSGLVYETVWLRILSRVVGNTVYATSVVLAAFMAGMAIGSYVIGRYADRVKNLLRLYAVLEFGAAIAAVGLTAALLHLTPIYQALYDLSGGSRVFLTVLQSTMAFALLLVPTSLMGGTLPVLSSYTKAFSIGLASRMGFLYGLNTLGAVLGVLCSGFVTIGAVGETVTFLGAAALTVAVATVAAALSRREPSDASDEIPAGQTAKSLSVSQYPASTRRFVGLAYAISGLAAMAYEVVWTRLFQIQVGTSIYSFSVMLAFYLVGIGIGSMVGGRLLGGTKRPLATLALAQMFIAIYSLLGLYISAQFHPLTLNLDLQFGNVLVMPALVVLPITIVLGAMFPVVCKCYVASENEVSGAVGRLYSLNTLGCIAGSLVCGFVLIGYVGTRGTMILLAGVNAALGLLFLMRESGAVQVSVLLEQSRRKQAGKGDSPIFADTRIRTVPESTGIRWRPTAVVSLGCLCLIAALAICAPNPFDVAVHQAVERMRGPGDVMQVFYNKESATATTTAVGCADKPKTKRLLVNGIGMSNLSLDTKLMAHLPLLLHPGPKKLLVVCFGMGTTVRSARVHPDIECDVVELVPEVYECFKYFHADAAEVLADPRIHHYADDGRNFLLMRPGKYDVISIDPPPPVWSAGCVNLYTKEFFELCKARLNEHGIMCLWIPPVQATEVWMIMKTYLTVFPNTQTWISPGYPTPGFYMIGYRDAAGPAIEGFRSSGNEDLILADLNEWNFERKIRSVPALANLRLMSPQELASYVEGSPVITDDHPYTEFPLWRSLFDPSFKKSISLGK